MSDYKLSDHEIIALGIGLNIIPNPNKPSKSVSFRTSPISHVSYDMLVKARLPVRNEEIINSIHDPRPGSPTLHMHIEMESRGIEEFFTSPKFKNDYSPSNFQATGILDNLVLEIEEESSDDSKTENLS